MDCLKIVSRAGSGHGSSVSFAKVCRAADWEIMVNTASSACRYPSVGAEVADAIGDILSAEAWRNIADTAECVLRSGTDPVGTGED